MASLYVVLTCVFFVFNFSSYRYIYVSAENRDETSDWKWAIRKIKELEQKVKIQDERISTLEKMPSDSEWKTMVELKTTVQKQNDRITKLEARIYELETAIQVEGDNKDPVKIDLPRQMHVLDTKQPIMDLKNSIRKARLLLPPTTVPVERAAFLAYFSSNTPAAIDNHILAFNTVITNVGNAYHPHTGTFIAPRSGLYVFTWTIRLWGDKYHSTQLLVDNNVINAIYFNPIGHIDGSVTGTAVVHVSQGDDVFIRTAHPNAGEIISDTFGRSSFAGWSLM